MVLYVVRHGQTEANEKHLFNGINKLDLTDKGIKQIEELIPKINNLNIDIIICSPLIRATHTANILNTKKNEILADSTFLVIFHHSWKNEPKSFTNLKPIV